MAEQTTYHFLPEDPCLTEQQLFGYIDGKLSAAEMFAVEKHLLDCPFCSDALEGLQKVKARDRVMAFVPPVSKGTASQKSEEEKKDPKVIPLFGRPRVLFAAAASIALILVVTFVMKTSMSNDSEPMAEVAQKEPGSEKNNSIVDNRKMDSVAAPASGEFKKVLPDREGVAQEEVNTKTPPEAPQGTAWSSAKTTDDANSNEGKDRSVMRNLSAAGAGGAGNANGAPASDLPQQAEAMDKLEKAPVPQEDQNLKQDVVSGNVGNAEDEQDASKKEGFFQHNNKASKQKQAAAAPSNAGPVGGAYAGGAAPQSTTAPTTESRRAETSGSEVAADDSVSVADTPRLYPLKPSDKDLDQSYETGVKMLTSGKALQSLVFFDEVLKYPKHRYYQDAQWEKSQALIQLGRKDEAKTLLNDIIKAGGRYKAQAEEALKKL